MIRTVVRSCLLSAALAIGLSHAADGVVIIGHASMKPLDRQTVEKIYTGKNIQVGEMLVTAVNAEVGAPIRLRFLRVFIGKTEDEYIGRWLVMRTRGLGKPPRELPNAAAIINFVADTPGAIGYIDESEVRPGMNVIVR
jgi:hypothetical protein